MGGGGSGFLTTQFILGSCIILDLAGSRPFSPLAAAVASMCDLTHVDKSIVGLLMSSKKVGLGLFENISIDYFSI